MSIYSDEEYKKRGHGPGGKPVDWPADQEFPPRGQGSWAFPPPGAS